MESFENRKACGVERHGTRWAVIDSEGGAMCIVKHRRTADALVGCSFDGARFVRRVAVARAVEFRGLAQGVGTKGRRGACEHAMAAFDSGHSAAWSVRVGWGVLDYWTLGKRAPWSVALAGTMP